MSSISSRRFAVEENSRVEVAAWLRAVDVPEDRLRLTLSVFGVDEAIRIRHWDLASIGGSFAWREFKGTFIAPPGTRSMVLSAHLDAASGEFYLDDAYAAMVQRIPSPDVTTIPRPIIVPAPVAMSASRGDLRIDSVDLATRGLEPRLLMSMHGSLRALAIELMEGPSAPKPQMRHFRVFVGNVGDPQIEASFVRAFPEHSWSEVGDQGYFLSIQSSAEGGVILLGARTEIGRFYGLQTLVQLIDSRDGTPTIAAVDVFDAPAIERRGVMMPIQWYLRRDLLFDTMTSLKMNFAWNQGSFVNEKFRFAWREPLLEREKDDLADYLDRAREAYVEAYLAISPKGEEPIDPPIFSSERDIDAVVSKMETLYQLGARHLGLSFDDQSNYGLDRLYGADVEVFDDDIGAAHAFFIREVFERIVAKYPDVRFMVVLMKYSGAINMSSASVAYLEALAALPSQIEFFSAVEFLEEARMVEALTERTHFMMDNFWARHYREPAPTYVLPLDRPLGLTAGLISGYAFLPMPPGVDDGAGVSWSSAAEYAWRGRAYVPDEAFQRAAARFVDESGSLPLRGDR